MNLSDRFKLVEISRLNAQNHQSQLQLQQPTTIPANISYLQPQNHIQYHQPQQPPMLNQKHHQSQFYQPQLPFININHESTQLPLIPLQQSHSHISIPSPEVDSKREYQKITYPRTRVSSPLKLKSPLPTTLRSEALKTRLVTSPSKKSMAVSVVTTSSESTNILDRLGKSKDTKNGIEREGDHSLTSKRSLSIYSRIGPKPSLKSSPILDRLERRNASSKQDNILSRLGGGSIQQRLGQKQTRSVSIKSRIGPMVGKDKMSLSNPKITSSSSTLLLVKQTNPTLFTVSEPGSLDEMNAQLDSFMQFNRDSAVNGVAKYSSKIEIKIK